MALVSMKGHTHQANLANMVITQTDSAHYKLYLNTSLVGVEQVVNYRFGKDSYKTAEEFIQLAKQHLADTLAIKLNKKELKIRSIKLNLGHATQFIVQLYSLDKITPKEVMIKNTFFHSIHSNKLAITFRGGNLPSNNYVLKNSNKHRIDLINENEKWIHHEPSKFRGLYLIVISILLLVVGLALLKIRKAI